MSTRVLLAVAALLVLGAAAYAARPEPETAEARVERIASELRCPVCQGQSIADSPSQSARQMREHIAQRVTEGRSDREIRDEFRASYGDWVVLVPEPAGIGALVWAGPLLALAGGAAVAVVLARRRQEVA